MENNLRKFKEAAGISGLELSRRTGIAPSIISNIENNRIKPWPGWKKRLSEALKVPEFELFPECHDSSKEV